MAVKTKKVEFYNVYYGATTLLSSNDKDIKQYFFNKIDNSNKGEPIEISDLSKKISEPTIEIVIFGCDKSGVFGMLSKKQDLKTDSLRRILSKDTTDMGDELIVEDFTYFFINKNNYKAAVIANNKAPAFQKHINRYFKNIFNAENYEKFEVIRISGAAKQKLKELKTITNISLIFSNESPPSDEVFGIRELFNLSQTDIYEAKVNLKTRIDSIDPKTIDNMNNSEFISEKFDELSISGNSDDNEYLIDVLKDRLTLKVDLDIADEYLKSSDDLNKIKETLIRSFNKI